jgi:hypothetical protein
MLRRIAGALLVVVPTAAIAFEAVDTLPYPSRSGFPAYPAEPARPVSFFAQAGLMYDSNPFRLPSGLDPRAFLRGSRDDTIMRVGIGAGYDQRIFGRQNLFLAARGEYYDFMRYSDMDHFAYRLNGEWRSEWGNELSTTFGADRSRRLVDPTEIRRPIANFVTADRFYGTGAYRFAADWRVRLAGETTRGERKGPGRDALELESSSLTAGIDYVTPLGNAFGVEARRADGEATLPEFITGIGFDTAEYTEREVSGTLSYRLGETLRVSGRLGRTNREYRTLTDRDFNGTTYRAAVEYLPGNKTILALDVYRAPQSIIDVAASHILATGTSFTMSWAPRVKLVFQGRVILERRQYSDAASIAADGALDETARIFRLGGGWEPRRFIELSAGIEYGERSTNVLFRDYDYVQLTLNAATRF